MNPKGTVDTFEILVFFILNVFGLGSNFVGLSPDIITRLFAKTPKLRKLCLGVMWLTDNSITTADSSKHITILMLLHILCKNTLL